jgi:hypothetical protein
MAAKREKSWKEKLVEMEASHRLLLMPCPIAFQILQAVSLLNKTIQKGVLYLYQ